MNSKSPLCENIQHALFGKPKTNSVSQQFVDQDYNVVQCINCKVYYVHPLITFTDEQWAKLYNNEYFAEQSTWLLHKREVELSQRFNQALSFIGSKNISFLDIGAGEGKTLLEGLKRGWNVAGIDIVDNRIDQAKHEDIKFFKGKFLEHEFEINQYDFIYLDSVLEHVLNPKEYLQKINRILKPGGIVYVGVPNEDSLFNDIRKIAFALTGKKHLSEKIKPFDSPYHVIGFNKKSLNFIFDKTNFKIKYMRNFGRKFDFLSCSPNQKGFWLGLFFLFPVEFIGNLLGRDVYYEAYLTKED
jgi:2-polyprenyl-3-methyl-5-hydroxy-6-metoxy-1,4-benzoquinol methylase